MERENMSKTNESRSIEVKCLSCSRTDKEIALLPIRFKGEDQWVCAKCLPKLIHG